MTTIAPEHRLLLLGREIAQAQHDYHDAKQAAERCPSARLLEAAQVALIRRDALLDQWPRQRETP